MGDPVKASRRRLPALLRGFLLLVYYGFAQYLPTQPMPGWRFAYRLRRLLVRLLFASCGAECIVKSRAYFGDGAGIVIGDRSQLGQGCRVENDLAMGDDVIMGPDVIIMSSSHAFQRTDITIREQGAAARRPVTVGDDVWIGTRVIVLPGVHIGSHSIIGTGAVVTKDVPEWSIVAGVPGRVIRDRRSQANQ